MLSRRKSRSGYAIIGILIVFLIIVVLTQNYFAVETPGGKPFAMSMTDRARSAAAALNYRNAQTTWLMKTEGQRLEINRMRQELDQLSVSMGSGGRFFVDQRGELRITTQLETKKFGEQFPLPRIR